jgi:hypothetical protein
VSRNTSAQNFRRNGGLVKQSFIVQIPGSHYAAHIIVPARRSEMTLCPVALVSGCRKCALFSMCPLKGVIGDYRKDPADPPARDVDPGKKPG